MTDIRNAIGHLADLVEHFVQTHGGWNGSLSEVDAIKKIAKIREATVVQEVADDAVSLGQEISADAKKIVDTVEGK